MDGNLDCVVRKLFADHYIGEMDDVLPHLRRHNLDLQKLGQLLSAEIRDCVAF